MSALLMLLAVTAAKALSVVSDPLNGALTPKAIPGAKVDYTISVTNGTLAKLDINTTVVTDAIPAQEKLCLADLGLTGSGPIDFAPNLSALTYGFTSLSNTGDDLDFSKDNGVTWTYSPVADSDGCDAQVTNIRVKTHGKMTIAGVASVRFRVMIR